MRVAIIDLGTNSVRFDVHSLGKGKGKLLHREKLMIRLGQGVFLKGRVDPAAVTRALHAFEHFRTMADSLRVQKIVAFGTSALREAVDSQDFVDMVKERSGIEVKIISGEEEAKLIALGVLTNMEPVRGRFALVDIGGGSTEISVARGRRVIQGNSFPLGTARIQQVFLKKTPPRPAALRELRGYIQNILGQRMTAEHWPKVPTIVGSSGTVRAVAKILDKKAAGFSVKDLSDLVEDMSSMTQAQLLEVPGMESKRADMILGGAVLLEEIALRMGASRIHATDFSLRDGIMEEEVRLARTQKQSLIELHIDDLKDRALRFGASEAHLRHMADLASQLFDRLKTLHQLDPQWKIYLLATVILRNCGEVIGFAGKEKHAYYIVKNSDFPSMQSWEHEFIARLCLLSHGGKISLKDLNSFGGDRKRRDAFRAILALVRVIDALDIGARTTIELRRVTVEAHSVRIVFGGQSTAGIEQLLTDRKKRFFEQVFGRELLLERWDSRHRRAILPS